MKPLAYLVSLVIAAFALIACNTVEGVGRDLESAGEAMQGD